jgi:hypothetical protein
MRRHTSLLRCWKFAFAIGAASLLANSTAHATIPYGGLTGGIPGALGPGLASPKVVPGKEYSHDIDHTTLGGGGVPDPQQVIAWDGSGGTADGLDYSGTRPNYPADDQVDALANRLDHLFVQVIGSPNLADRAHMIFSHDDEISVYPNGPPPVGGVGAFNPVTLPAAFHGGPVTLTTGKQIGGTGELSYELATAYSPPSTVGIWATQADINGMPNPIDVDAVELWGPEPAFKADSEKYSLDVDFFSGTSVWSLDLANNVSTPYISQNQIRAAVTSLLGPVPGGAVLPFPTFIDGDNAINLDALMVQDIIPNPAGPDTFDRDPAGGIGDRILFSIRQIPNPNDPDGYYATGSEVFVLDGTQPNVATYLFHGGHLWDHAYALNNLQITPALINGAYAIIDLNALEAVSEGVVPEPATWMVLLVGGVAVVAIRRRS